MLASLLDVALDLTANLAAEDRYHRLLRSVRKMLPSALATLMRLEGGALLPLAVEGLSAGLLARRFQPEEHPRLARILAARGRPVRFSADCDLPDPFDDQLDAHSLPLGRIHACMGCALLVEGDAVGVITLDALEPDAFDAVSDAHVAAFAALAAAAMRTAGLIDALEAAARRDGLVARQLLRESQQRRGGEILGLSEPARHLQREIATVAESDLPVLITGETGVGKEVVARGIHQRSSRRQAPLIYVNCAALPESIAESELFGHVRGAFTGATENRAGKFDAADRGTLFLDEVGELPLSTQPKLLRVLQSGEVQRVGSDKATSVDVRVIAATNRNLSDEVVAGRFRADLYHRLRVYPIEVPPLRERAADIPIFAAYFLDCARTRLGLGPARYAPDALQALEAGEWPGNVRELEHVVLRAALRAAGGRRHQPVQIERHDLGLARASSEGHAQPSPSAAEVAPLLPLSEAVDEFERRYVRVQVDAAGGNWAEAARRLGVDRGNLHRRARRLGLL